MSFGKYAAMLPEGITIQTHVTQRGTINLKIEIEPQHAASFLSIGNMLIKAAKEAQKRDAANQLTLFAEKAKTQSNAAHQMKLQRIALSVWRKTRKRKLAAKASNYDLTAIDYIIKQANKRQRQILRAIRDRAIIKAALRGDCHIKLGIKYGLHQKSVTRIVNQARQAELI